METVEKIAAIQNKIQELTKQIHEIEALKRDKGQELLLEVLCDEAILNESSWVIDENCLKSDVHKHKKLSDLLSTDYHCHFEINNLFLNFDDNDITLWFTTTKDLENFIRSFNLKLNLSSLRREKEHYEKIISDSQKTLDLVNERIKYIESIGK